MAFTLLFKSSRNFVWCQTTPKTPAYVLHYSSFTPPPLFRSKYVLCFPQEVLIPSSPNLKSLRNFRGLGAFFLFFASIDRELKSLHICVPISVKFAKVQDLGFGFTARVNRRPASSRKYRQLAAV